MASPAEELFADLLPTKKSGNAASPGPAFQDDAVLPAESSSDALRSQAPSLGSGMPMVST